MEVRHIIKIENEISKITKQNTAIKELERSINWASNASGLNHAQNVDKVVEKMRQVDYSQTNNLILMFAKDMVERAKCEIEKINVYEIIDNIEKEA